MPAKLSSHTQEQSKTFQPGGAAHSRGLAMIELVVALAILAAVAMPLAYSFDQDRRAVRAYYYRAVAIEIVDGELEALAAGEWRAYKPGAYTYVARAESARNLPAGRFELTVADKRVGLVWRPSKAGTGGLVERELTFR